MKTGRCWILCAAVATTVLAATGGQAQVTGSYDGEIRGAHIAQPVAAAAALSQSGKFLTGTVAVGDSASFGGAYIVNGKATARKIKVSGPSATGAVLKWRGKILGSTVQGKMGLKQPGARLVGLLALTRNVSTSDGSGCDAVFEQNSTFFTDQVLGRALVACRSCHVAGGQAEVTRLRITPGDARATARSIAPFVNSANPSASRFIEKPLGLVPHGGQQQITAGSPEEQILHQWADLVAQAQCH